MQRPCRSRPNMPGKRLVRIYAQQLERIDDLKPQEDWGSSFIYFKLLFGVFIVRYNKKNLLLIQVLLLKCLGHCCSLFGLSTIASVT